MELMTQFFYYNAFVIRWNPFRISLKIINFYILGLQAANIFAFCDSGLWRELSPVEIFIVGYGVRDYSYMFLFSKRTTFY